MEFSATREMKYCDWSIDDMRAADCKKLAEKPEGVFRQAKKSRRISSAGIYTENIS